MQTRRDTSKTTNSNRFKIGRWAKAYQKIANKKKAILQWQYQIKQKPSQVTLNRDKDGFD
ncbi:hypothetical protein I79_015640 [Cricetulus griseus]|uniref:Uncharacterized protein n=1 Tax=Cricetulus griseus TaxID=10029 RepID=G3HXC1_CRIGR|nr:hypothetical protein I79_015640 [Cricetulus griseus]